MADIALRTARPEPPRRPERMIELDAMGVVGDVARPLSTAERILQITGVRRIIVLVVLCLAWQLYATWLANPLLFPTLSETLDAFWDAAVNGPLLKRTMSSLQVLLVGYAAGLALAGILTTVAVSTRVGNDLLSTLTAMFNPLPAIALLPLALLWFGLSSVELNVPLGPLSFVFSFQKSLAFVIVHSVLWAVALNTHSGFSSVSPTLRMAGQNCGLRGISYVALLLVPAAFPSILTGLKIGWAFAWRTLIAAELVFGVSSRSGGLGWFIFENRNQLEIPSVFAGLLTVILIGLVVESVIFRSIENVTIRRWGMQS
jgi:NitT/TauT family transport system permease protein